LTLAAVSARAMFFCARARSLVVTVACGLALAPAFALLVARVA
jgi:hypothetical protein